MPKFDLTPTRHPRLVVVCGPTGVGKTGFAIRLAQHFGGQIVGADSMQVYRHMDVGTAKPTAAERDAVAHHLVDILDPDEPFDAATYGLRSRAVVQQLLQENVRPFVVGGTGLYIKALIYGMFDAPRANDGEYRRLKEMLAREGSAAMHDRLKRHDAEAAARIHPNDEYRILRALAVIEHTGRAISDHHRDHGFRRPRYQVLSLGLDLPRSDLYARIDQRVDDMIAAGLLNEVRGLLQRGYGSELKAMKALGYRHMAEYIAGRIDWDEAVRTLKRDHRRYAKRQLTWFRADPRVFWLEPCQVRDAAEMVESFLGAR